MFFMDSQGSLSPWDGKPSDPMLYSIMSLLFNKFWDATASSLFIQVWISAQSYLGPEMQVDQDFTLQSSQQNR